MKEKNKNLENITLLSEGVAGIIANAIDSKDKPLNESYKFYLPSVGDLQTISMVQRQLRNANFDFQMSSGLYPTFKTEKELVSATLYLYQLNSGRYVSDRFYGELLQRGLINKKGMIKKNKVKEFKSL